ncbi:hypothetical protein [Mediterraneibacter glycyrrhizinilyticus]|uniref:hypothetical protein n=1 Tax=Mediterraneibacter glycyrrhizinilyticus TaxID=342942 RepID=UPI0025AB554C|nr:hypothetical protein [Mediterraneibacter glycyrrhizinilyticus]MDN0043004.1 hypothetical protein [Mediterraneibacter glycyrrhizinilyticus]
MPYLNLYRFTEEKIAMPQTDSMYLYVVAEARRLMLDENRNATEAAFEARYESAS